MGICIKEALKIILSSVKKVSYEILPIEDAKNKISADIIYATHNLPHFNNSAMDGYGVKIKNAGEKVKITGTILAGNHKQINIKNGEVIKIMTGAKIPYGVEAVVPQEFVKNLDKNHIVLPNNIKENQHLRFIGEDIKKGELLLNNGDEINYATISILTSQGITHIKVYRKPKISVFTSGQELKLHHEKINDYQIYNSNTPTIMARAKELGADVTFIGIAKDSKKSLKKMIKNSLYADFIITSGGISVGEVDFTHEAFNSLQMEVLFDGITIKPGKPTRFGKIGSTYILNLPGNPLATALIFEVFGKIILQKLSGNKNIYHKYIKTNISEKLKNKKGRTTIIPGLFNGKCFMPSKKRLPGMVGVLHNCNSMIVLNRKNELIEKNDIVKILPINWNFFTNNYEDFFN